MDGNFFFEKVIVSDDKDNTILTFENNLESLYGAMNEFNKELAAYLSGESEKIFMYIPRLYFPIL